MRDYTQQYAIGTQYLSSGKHPNLCTVTDFLTVTNSAGDIVKTYYQAEHEFMGQTVTDYEVVAVTVARGMHRLIAKGDK